MRSTGTITGRHLAIAVLVVIVVNVQLTWWILFTTGQARDRLELERTLLEARATAWAEAAALAGPQHEPPLPDGMEIVVGPVPSVSPPAVPVAGDRLGRSIRPTWAVWDGILEEYRRRIVMMVSEGAFFAVLLVVFMGLLWRTFRREVDLERQHRNFLSAITHELKSPIAAIRIALETVSSGRAEGEVSRRFIGNALGDVERLDRLVQKVLQATRFGSRFASLRRQRRSLSWIVERALAVFEPGATAAGATIETEIADDVWAEVDDEAMTIAVSNLLENALKYGGRPAEIAVDLKIEDDNAVLEVSDNGDGIPKEEIPLVFHRFYRAGDEMTRTTQGTGLGLYLVQRIVKAHHGTVEVAATGGGGTVMRVTVPGATAGGDGE